MTFIQSPPLPSNQSQPAEAASRRSKIGAFKFWRDSRQQPPVTSSPEPLSNNDCRPVSLPCNNHIIAAEHPSNERDQNGSRELVPFRRRSRNLPGLVRRWTKSRRNVTDRSLNANRRHESDRLLGTMVEVSNETTAVSDTEMTCQSDLWLAEIRAQSENWLAESEEWLAGMKAQSEKLLAESEEWLAEMRTQSENWLIESEKWRMEMKTQSETWLIVVVSLYIITVILLVLDYYCDTPYFELYRMMH